MNVRYVVGLDSILNTRSNVYTLHFSKANKSKGYRAVFQLLLQVDGGEACGVYFPRREVIISKSL